MSEPASAMPSSCTLDARAFRLRDAEFRSLFGRSLRHCERIDARSARLVLDPACEAELRDLLAREQRCCTFFAFDLQGAGEGAVLTVRVPEAREDALAFLLGLTL